MNLFISRNPPNASGPGGSQRAMHLLRAVAQHGPIDFLLLHRALDTESASDTLDSVRPLVRNCLRLEVDEWAPSNQRWPSLPWKAGQILESATLGSIDYPAFSRKTLGTIGRMLPQKNYDTVFAARLSSARVADDLIAGGYLSVSRKVCDFDDLLSRFKIRDLELNGAKQGKLRRALLRREIRIIRDAELKVAGSWQAASLANEQDAGGLSKKVNRIIHTVPNVVGVSALPPKEGHGNDILFVGHLGYSPNAQGLARFLQEVWPRIRESNPAARFRVVGMSPNPDLVELIASTGAEMHANVPSVAPYYEQCDIVVAPIWQGGGTRIKILEAMAYGKPVVSTTVGAEGLGVQSGIHALIADSAADFAAATLRMLTDGPLRAVVVAEGRKLQQARFGPAAVTKAVSAMMLAAT